MKDPVLGEDRRGEGQQDPPNTVYRHQSFNRTQNMAEEWPTNQWLTISNQTGEPIILEGFRTSISGGNQKSVQITDFKSIDNWF